MDKSKHFDTLAIHAGGDEKHANNAIAPPIFMTATFEFDDLEHVDSVMSFSSSDYVYTRGNNPTLRLLEERMAVLESGGQEIGAVAVAFASGMAAISSVLLSLLKAGDTLIIHRTLYGSTHTFTTKWLTDYGITCLVYDFSDMEGLSRLLEENGAVKAIYFETPCNPNMQVLDMTAIATIAKTHGVRTVVDNTFATPYLQRPLLHGVDIVVHSATKYLSGHGDVLGGLAIGCDEAQMHRIKFEYMCELGGVMSPFNAWLILRGMKTLPVRMRQHCANAQDVAAFLDRHQKIGKVYYPGLSTSEDYIVASKQMELPGAMIAFEVLGDRSAAKRMVDHVKLAKLAVSLGDCETLIEMPSAMTHRGYDNECLTEFGLTDTMVRLSVGLEDVRDIISDLEQALEYA